MSMELIIGNLLIRHNCVVIPAFGGFVARKVSASIDYRNGIMQPPRKSVLFNAQLINNDGLLVTELAREKGIPYTEALTEVSDTVRSWQDQLNNGMRITLDKIGYLFLDAERNMCFEQDRFFNLLMESYGLAKVHFIPEEDVALVQHRMSEREVYIEERTQTATAQEREEEPVMQEETPVITLNAKERIRAISKDEATVEAPHKQSSDSRKRLWKYVAAAALLPVVFYSYWLPMETRVLESGVLSLRDFNPLYKAGEGQYKPQKPELKSHFPEERPSFEEEIEKLPEHVSVYRFQYDPDLSMTVRVQPDVPTANETQSTVLPVESTTSVTGKKYHFIVGCFSDHANAENLVQTLTQSGFAARIVDKHGGLYRVSVGDADSESGLSSIRTRSAADGYEGWVLKTK